MSPRHIAKRYLPDPAFIRARPRLRWLQPILEIPGIWHFGRRSVAGGLSVGLFLAFIPIPVQQLLSIPAAIALRVNLPAALSGVWVSNPLTFAPLFYFAYRVGLTITGDPAHDFHLEFSLANLSQSLHGVARPLAVGCLVCATVSAVAGNLLVRGLWRLALVARMRERRRLRASLPPL